MKDYLQNNIKNKMSINSLIFNKICLVFFIAWYTRLGGSSHFSVLIVQNAIIWKLFIKYAPKSSTPSHISSFNE